MNRVDVGGEPARRLRLTDRDQALGMQAPERIDAAAVVEQRHAGLREHLVCGRLRGLRLGHVEAGISRLQGNVVAQEVHGHLLRRHRDVGVSLRQHDREQRQEVDVDVVARAGIHPLDDDGAIEAMRVDRTAHDHPALVGALRGGSGEEELLLADAERRQVDRRRVEDHARRSGLHRRRRDRRRIGVRGPPGAIMAIRLATRPPKTSARDLASRTKPVM